MGNLINHFKTVCKHKNIVYRECKACGIWWRGVTHDLSKFSITEFAPSANFFQGDKSPIEAEKARLGYSAAWQHHKGHNPHHWEYWTDFGSNGEVIANKIPYVYVVEMVCDWIGAGMVYGGDKWTQDEPINYYHKVRAGRHFHRETETLIMKFLICIQQRGLGEFHKMARCEGDYAYLAVDYAGLHVL